MSNYQFPIPGGAHQEEIILFTRRHWASMLGVILLSLIMFFSPIIIILLLGFYSQDLSTNDYYGLIVMVSSIYYLVFMTYIFTEWLNYYFDITIVTKNDLININQTGVFNREITELSMRQIQEVAGKSEGVLETIFSYGKIEIKTASEKELAIIPNIPNPYEVAQKILDLHQRQYQTGNIETNDGHDQINIK